MIRTTRKVLLCLPVLGLLLAACSESPAKQAAREQAEQLALRKRQVVVAQTAVDRGLMMDPACINIGGQGTFYSPSDAEIVPSAQLWRFLEAQGIAVRQMSDPSKSSPQVRFFIKDSYSGNVYGDKYCFGKWVVTNVVPVTDGKAETRFNVEMVPYDVTLRITKVPSQAWLDSRLIQANLADGLNSLTENQTIRGVLPDYAEQLPGGVDKTGKRLDQ